MQNDSSLYYLLLMICLVSCLLLRSNFLFEYVIIFFTQYGCHTVWNFCYPSPLVLLFSVVDLCIIGLVINIRKVTRKNISMERDMLSNFLLPFPLGLELNCIQVWRKNDYIMILEGTMELLRG